MNVELFKSICKENGLPEPKRNYQFDKDLKFKLDFYFERGAFKVGLEVDGSYTSSDASPEKYNALSKAGIHLLKVPVSELNTLKTTVLIKMALKF